MRTFVALAMSVAGVFAAGCFFGPPVSTNGMEDARVTPAAPLRNAEVRRPRFWGSVAFSLSAKPCECPEGFIKLTTETVWAEGRPVEGFEFDILQADAPEDGPSLQQERGGLRLLPGRYSVRVRPNVHGTAFGQEIVIRNVELLDPGLDYKLTLNLNGAMVRVSGADWYRVHPGGTRLQAERDEDAIGRIPATLIYTQSSRQFDFPVPEGSYDIYIVREGRSPVWVENYRPEVGYVNVIRYDDLFAEEDGDEAEPEDGEEDEEEGAEVEPEDGAEEAEDAGEIEEE